MGAGALRMPRFPASHAECCRTDAGTRSSARVADPEVDPLPKQAAARLALVGRAGAPLCGRAPRGDGRPCLAGSVALGCFLLSACWWLPPARVWLPLLGSRALGLFG